MQLAVHPFSSLSRLNYLHPGDRLETRARDSARERKGSTGSERVTERGEKSGRRPAERQGNSDNYKSNRRNRRVNNHPRAMDLALLLLVVLLRQEVAALRLLHIKVPPYILRGQSALLECSYDMESDKLYSILWYKDNEEFYRYLPKGEIRKHIYTVEGVTVNERESDQHRVVLHNVGLQTSGKYKCDVSAEAPHFSSVNAEASMEVIALPEENPRITVEEKVYVSGDVLALNCTSDKSHPPAQLKWFINGMEVDPDSETWLEKDGLYSTISSLRLELEPDHLTTEKINVRCEATVRSTHEISEPLIDMRDTEVFVQGHANLTRSSLYLLTCMLLLRLLLPV